MPTAPISFSEERDAVNLFAEITESETERTLIHSIVFAIEKCFGGA